MFSEGQICLGRVSLTKDYKREKRHHLFAGVLKGAEVGFLPILTSYEEQPWPVAMPLAEAEAEN